MRTLDPLDSRSNLGDMTAQDEKPHEHELEDVENGIDVGQKGFSASTE